MPAQPVDNSSPQSRSAEFSSGGTGLIGQGSTRTIQQMAPQKYLASSVLSAFPGHSGMSAETYNAKRALSYYRS